MKPAKGAPMIHPRYAAYLFGFFLSCFMTFMVSGLSTLRALGLADHFMRIWLGNWLISWAISFPVVLIVAPLMRRMVATLTLPRAP